MGKTGDRLYRDRVYRPRPVWRRATRRNPDIRVASARPRVVPTTDTTAGMEILRGVYALTQINHVTIDSLVFRLHSNATVILLVTFSIAVTTRQYVGNPIDCVHSRDIPEDVLNTYCWIHSTYTVIDAFRKSSGLQAAYPGVASSYSRQSGKSAIKQVKYYQWVAFSLFFQGAFDNTNPAHQLDFTTGSNLHCSKGLSSLSPKQSFPLPVKQTVYILIYIICKYSFFMDSYCWIHSTYSIDYAFKMKVGVDVIYPGIINSRNNEKSKRYHKYYQWTPFVLLCQAILFYTPRWLWKSWEGGKIHALMMDLDIGICSEIEKKQKKKLMLDYLWENLRYHNWWAYKYYLCEVLALINVIGQMFLMNRFFDGAFLTFGIEVISFLDSDQEDRIDPMIQIFPRMTKCTFYKYGVSGEVERHDAICILPLNVVNEKIYVFLWFWFIILGILTFVTVIYRIIIIFSPRMRVYLLRMRFRLIRQDAIDLIVRRSKMGDWFLFYMLGENVDSVIFRDVMQELANKLAKHNFHHVGGFKGDIQEA